jgi:amidohydrolase
MLEQMISGICNSMGCDYDFRFDIGYPALICDESVSHWAAAGLTAAMGPDNLVKLTEPRMGGEDFSFLAQKVPATFLRLGCTPENVAKPAPTHNGAFNPDEECFAVGVRGLCTSTISVLRGLSE